jgi:23S rRNA (cytosine1962-C5)-methyltransferase
MPEVAQLIARLESCLPEPVADQHRLFHGRGGVEPALRWLTLDRYPPLLLATLFEAPPEGFVPALADWLEGRASELGVDCLLVQHRYQPGTPMEVVFGEPPAQPVAVEDGLSFHLDFQRGQNIGFFADMAPGRQWLRERAAGRKVLNLFSFTCSFSVSALAGGAESVVNIDLSKPALALGQRNHALNGQDVSRVTFLPHDIFRSWKKLHSLGRYDLVVIDPPSRQKGSFVAKKDYRKVVRQLHRLLQPEAELLACLNDPFLDQSFLEQTVLENLDGTEKIDRLPAAPGFAEPGEAALKAVTFRYRRPDEL